MKERMDVQGETNYYIRYSEGLGTTGVSDLAISVKARGNKDQSGLSYHLHYKRNLCASII